MIKSLIQGSELAPIFSTVEDTESSLGVVVNSHHHNGKSLFSRYLVREAAQSLTGENANKRVMVFDGEATLTTLIEALTTNKNGTRFDIITTMAGGYGTAQCFLDLLKHNLEVAKYNVGLVLIDVPDLWPHLTDTHLTMCELPLWRGLKELLLDNGIDFVLTKPSPLEFRVGKDNAFNRDAVMESSYDTFEVAARESRAEPNCFPITTGIYKPSEDSDPTGTLVVYSSADVFEFKVSKLVGLMYKLQAAG